MAKTTTGALVQEFIEVLNGVIAVSPTIDISGSYDTDLQLQGALAAIGSSTGTEFQVQVSSSASGDEDWVDYGGAFTDLIGTADDASLTTAALADATNLIDTKDNTSPVGVWVLVEDPAIADSEMVLLTGLNVGSVDILDGLTNGHTTGGLTKLWDIATSRNIRIQGTNKLRARLTVNNAFDAAGERIVYKLSKTITTEL